MSGFAWKNFDTMKRGSKIKTSSGLCTINDEYKVTHERERDKGVQELDKLTIQMS